MRMAGDFHESYEGGAIEPPSERSTGLVFAAVALIVAILKRNSPTVPWVALGTGLMFVAVSLAAPSVLKPLNILWFKFGLLLHRVVNPLVMFAIFFVVFVPAGIIMRICYDPLRRSKVVSSYWIDRKDGGHTAGSMINQF